MNKYQIILIVANKLAQHKKIFSENIKKDQIDNDFDILIQWLNEYKDSPKTQSIYSSVSEKFLMWLTCENIGFKDVNNNIVMKYTEFLQNPEPVDVWCGQAESKSSNKWKPFIKGLSPSSIHYHVQVLKSMFEYFIQMGYIEYNPFRTMRRKRGKTIKNQAIERYFTKEEFDYIINFINKKPGKNDKELKEKARLKWLFTLLYLTGCRRSEIANANMTDIFKKRDKYWFKVVGKGDKYREIPVSEQLILEFKEYRRSFSLPPLPSQSDYYGLILSIEGNQKVSDSMIYKMIKNLFSEIYLYLSTDLSVEFDKLKFKQASTHWIRHTSATHQVDAGIDIRTVQKNLGHSSLETTMKYQHREDDLRHQEIESKFKI